MSQHGTKTTQVGLCCPRCWRRSSCERLAADRDRHAEITVHDLQTGAVMAIKLRRAGDRVAPDSVLEKTRHPLKIQAGAQPVLDLRNPLA
jgi:hypothetical protein